VKVPVKRALISVSDKSGLVEFARRLVAAGVELVASGGTATSLSEAGLPVTSVSDVTGAPELLGGRVKTLHPRIHAGILARRTDPEHQRQLEEQGIKPFELVVVNLYPFGETVAAGDVSVDEAIEQIDIGGPSLIRAAAKNHESVAVVTSPAWYGPIAEQVQSGGIDHELRVRLAREAFFHTAAYDAAIVGWMERDEELPIRLVLPMRRVGLLRYGENPHQPGAIYLDDGHFQPWSVLHGKEMSFNNHLDLDSARRLVHSFVEPAAVIVKHTNPCGVAIGSNLVEAYQRAWECDPLSAFGGVVAFNRELDVETAQAIVAGGFIEIVAADPIRTEALDVLAKRKDLRVVATGAPLNRGLDLRRVEDGMVGQLWDGPDETGWSLATSRKPTSVELASLRLAWTVAANSKSNAVVIARDGMAVGIGAGDQSRVGAARRALVTAGATRALGAVAASDAFFPFPDGVVLLAEAGVVAVVAPGGSIRDPEVVAEAERLGMTFLLAERRHFRH
jgi:phosphoribosylaminoimidazolecarboxamide formyltransferase / IMP cyclohydrolase